MELNRKEIIWNLERLVDKYAENGSYNTYCTLLDSCALIRELTEENEMLRKQLEPFKVKQCFTCSFYGVGYDHMPCCVCRDYDKYKWLGNDIHIGDIVGTIKGRGVVSVMSGDTVTVDLDGDHGSYLFFKKDVWEITEDNAKQ